MMKLIVQIPCFNEEKTLPLVVKSIPKKIKGISKIEVLVIDDGSTDRTSEVARRLGVAHIVRHSNNKGLAFSFANGIQYALNAGADIIVNTDADNQYPQKDIPRLIDPILKGRAEIVIADRQTSKIKHFSAVKKFLQYAGSDMVKFFSGAHVPDAVSGFRAYSRPAAMQLNIVSDFSYVIESIIQAEYKKIPIASIKVETNPPLRKSRLFKNMFQHIRQSTATMLRIYTMYRPFKVFLVIGAVVIYFGFFPALRFVYYYFQGEGSGHIQSLIFSAILIMVGFQIVMTGLVADLIGINRKLSENILLRIKDLQLKSDGVSRKSGRSKKKSNGKEIERQGYGFLVN